jgi:signal transduction histidine kinase
VGQELRRCLASNGAKLMAQSEALKPPRHRGRWPMRIGRDNRFARAVASAPANVQTKLLVAFLGIAALLVLVAVLGLRFLSQSNARVEGLGRLQQRETQYQTIKAQANVLRQLLAPRAQSKSFSTLTGAKSLPEAGRRWLLADYEIREALSIFPASTDERNFGFVPPAADERLLKRIRRDLVAFKGALNTISALDRNGITGTKFRPALQAAITVDQDVWRSAVQLANRTQTRTQDLILANQRAHTSSRTLFIAVSTTSVVLALALGLLISWSLIGPIRRTEARLEEIAAGDFSGQLDVPNRDELGSLAANVNRMNDELRRLYGELEAASQHKSEFLANMSHELRTPLNAIIGFSEVLHEQMFGELNERQLAYVTDVLEAGRHLLSLINDVLDLAKIEAGRLELELSEFAVPDVLRSAVSMHAERASRGDIELALSTQPEEITITADERRVRQVVFNLLSNAVKFTPPQGRVDVFAQLDNGRVEIAVADTGPGISAEDLERIFEEFEQTTAGKQVEGTGLGLPLSRKLVELHGGRLWAESEPGKGSTFYFTLPIRQEVA